MQRIIIAVCLTACLLGWSAKPGIIITNTINAEAIT
jgi:hypothetical protein